MARIRTYLSGRRVAALAFMLGVAALVGLGAWLALSALGVSDEEIPPPPPILLNDPPAPVHTGGEPYPHGAFPPGLEVVWERATDYLRQPVSNWAGIYTVTPDDYADFFLQNPRHPENFLEQFECPAEYVPPSTYLHVENQLLFSYDEALEEPEAAILEELRAAGVEFESVTVFTANDYADHNPESFHNWLLPSDGSYGGGAALERLGAELHPDARTYSLREHVDARYRYLSKSYGYEVSPHPEELNPPPPAPPKTIYQVKLHGLTENVGDLEVQNSEAIKIGWGGCGSRSAEIGIFTLLIGGLYTVFGDDVVIVLGGVPLTDEAQPSG